MNTVHMALLKPHKAQMHLVKSHRRYTLCRAGRRGGKTTALAVRAVMAAVGGKSVLYAAPTNDQTQAFWRACLHQAAPMLNHNVGIARVVPKELRFPTGGQILARTAWKPDTLRGQSADELLLDEFQMLSPEMWEEVGLPMLLDSGGKSVICYTPPRRGQTRPARHVRRIWKMAVASEDWQTVHFTSRDNPHLDHGAFDQIAAQMTASARRRELEAVDDDEVDGALWRRDSIVEDRPPQDMARIVIGVDPSGTVEGDAVGIVAAGVDNNGKAWVLDDISMDEASPEQWARRVVQGYADWNADRVVAEVNFGGDMVTSLLRTVEPSLPIRTVHASRGKAVRAEPVAALYEQGRVFHADDFPALVDEMISWTPAETTSPDRMDALVWALTDLMLQHRPRWGLA